MQQQGKAQAQRRRNQKPARVESFEPNQRDPTEDKSYCNSVEKPGQSHRSPNLLESDEGSCRPATVIEVPCESLTAGRPTQPSRC
jgi:hypothetical protein